MGNFNRDDRGGNRGFGRGGGRGGFNDRRGGGFRSGGFGGGERREMFKTQCSNCGKDCEVPFRPTQGKPVYCSDCFEKMGGRRSDSPREERSDFRAPKTSSFDPNKEQLDAIRVKVDKILALLEAQKAPEVALSPVQEEVKEVKAPKAKKKTSVKKD